MASEQNSGFLGERQRVGMPRQEAELATPVQELRPALLVAVLPNVTADGDGQWPEQLALDVLFEQNAGDVFDHALQIEESFAGVAKPGARLEQHGRRPALAPPAFTPIGEPAGVRQHRPRGDPFVERLVDEIRLIKVLGQRPVEGELSSLNELEREIGQRRLAHRASTLTLSYSR